VVDGTVASARPASVRIAGERISSWHWRMRIAGALFYGADTTAVADAAARLAEYTGADRYNAACWLAEWRLSRGRLEEAAAAVPRLYALAAGPGSTDITSAMFGGLAVPQASLQLANAVSLVPVYVATRGGPSGRAHQ
jgi:hypothetical protein